jgi:hypothetical protein
MACSRVNFTFFKHFYRFNILYVKYAVNKSTTNLKNTFALFYSLQINVTLFCVSVNIGQLARIH